MQVAICSAGPWVTMPLESTQTGLFAADVPFLQRDLSSRVIVVGYELCLRDARNKGVQGWWQAKVLPETHQLPPTKFVPYTDTPHTFMRVQR